jgi:Putative zinc-finger
MTIRAPEQMACREFVELVTGYLEGTLPLPDRTRFEHHLVFCTWCVDYLQQMRDTLRLAGRLTEEDVPSEAKDELLRAFRHWKGGVP